MPSSTMVAEGFQVQASGESAISVIGSNFAKASKVILNGRPVSTAFGSSTGVTALVPPELYSREGAIEVAVQNADGQSSNVVLFRVFPLTGPAPRITRLHPESCIVGAPFNVQPDGKSALGVEGSDFTPGAVVYLDRSALNTTFGGPGLLSALLSAELLRTPGRLKVWVRNPDEKESEGAYFEVKPQPVSHGRSR